MNCSEAHRYLHAYIDEEFDERECVEIEHHLSVCESCRDEVAFYRAMRQRVKKCVPREVAPIHLEGRIRNALRQEDIRPIRSFSMSFAAVMAAFVFGGVSLWPGFLNVFSPSVPVKGASTGGNNSPLATSPPISTQPVLSISGQGGILVPAASGQSMGEAAFRRKQLVQRCLRWKRQKQKWLRAASFPTVGRRHHVAVPNAQKLPKLLPTQGKCDENTLCNRSGGGQERGR